VVLLKYLLPLLFIAYAFGEIAKFKLFPAVSIGFFDFVLMVILIIWVFFVKKGEYFLKKSFLIFCLIALISLIINFQKFTLDQISISSMYLIRFVLYGGLYFVFSDIGKLYKNTVYKYMFFSGLLIIIFGLFQYILYRDLRNLYFLGWDNHMYRLLSTFLDPNFTGSFLVLFIIFIFIMKDKLFSSKWIFYVVLSLNFLAIVLTFSRGAILMLLVSVVMYSLITKKWKITFGLFSLFVLVFFILSPLFYIENTNLLRFASTEARLESSKKALEIYKENPIGVGFNTYRYARRNYENQDWTNLGPSHAGAGIDNSLILVLVTTGIVGLISFLYFIFNIFKLGFTYLTKDKIALVLIVSSGGLLVNSMFINSLFYSFLMIWIFILAGITQSNSRG
jgi:O-antigen ligase